MNIILAPAETGTATWWYSDRQDPETQKYNPLAPSSIDSLKERLSRASSSLTDFNQADSFFWVAKSDSEVVGHVTMQNINRMMLTAEIGYGVSRHARGRGVGTFEVRLLVRSAFEQTPLRKLIAFVHEDNQPSRRLLEKVGFHQEGLLREHYLVNGLPTNEVIYGLLKGEVI
jgi:ribosomal-protein-alanine N-acetyltransferase